MIHYTLKCDQDHRFDSWFQSASAYEKLAKAGMVSCTTCGSLKVEKAIMAPSVSLGGSTAPTEEAPAPDLSTPASPAEKALAELRGEIEKNSDYVGSDFAKEARAIHDGSAPERMIHGEARGDEARKLVEDGVPVVPLPFLPTRKTN